MAETTTVGLTLDELLESIGGLAGACKMFGWQGGTIHQAKAEMRKRLAAGGIYETMPHGILGQLTINGVPMSKD